MTKSKSLVIIDWDDTLFPTSWTTKNLINLNDIEVRTKYLDFFSELDDIIYKLLQKISEFSKIIIITNAYPVWIKLSSMVLPKTKYLLTKIKVVSAKKNYGSVYSDSFEWKKHSFMDEVNDNTNIISIGDAMYEYKALINLDNNKRILKSVKFADKPTYEILKDQLETLDIAIKKIILIPNNLDLVFG